MVLFLVFFPVIVLVCFTYLVSCHHTKLYAPSDFANERNFMRSIEQGLNRSPRFAALERVTEEIKAQIDALPLLIFARLPVDAQGLLKAVYLSSIGDHESIPATAEKAGSRPVPDSAEILEQRTGWIERRDGNWVLSEKGRREVPQFIEITIPRLL